MGVNRVGIVFSGGPAPAANAVIAAAATSFLEDGREVVGFFHGYSNLIAYHPVSHRLQPDKHYRVLQPSDVVGLRNQPGILIGTSRANPASEVRSPADLDDPAKTEGIANTYKALVDLGIDALINIGGDGSLRSANLLWAWQQSLPERARRVHIVHLPKTIDNDYHGIDFTFGYFTAVDVLSKQLQNLRADADATSAYFIVETMGRKAGWLAYGVGIAGEAALVVSVEDAVEDFTTFRPDPDTGDQRQVLDLDRLVDHIVDLICTREAQGLHSGTVVLAEGIAELLPPQRLGNADATSGHVSLRSVGLSKEISRLVARRYEAKMGRSKKVRGVQLGYAARSAAPHAYDVMLGSQLGIGAYRALVDEGLDHHMVTLRGQFELDYLPFEELVDPDTLVTRQRFIERGSDFHKMARFLETRTEASRRWTLGPRREG